jgi:hypothetical protein
MSQLSLSLDATSDPSSFWGELRHGGLLLSPSALASLLKTDLPALPLRRVEYLRTALTPILASDTPSKEAVTRLLDAMLEDTLGFATDWLKGSEVSAIWGRKAMTGEVLKPRRLWIRQNGEILPVFVSDSAVRLGVGRGRREAAKVVEWLRKASQPLALLTNGRQWRIIHAGADYDAFAEWDAEGFFEQGLPSGQLAGLRALLHDPTALIQAIQASRKGQAELSQVLGERVRLAVELLIRAQSSALDGVRNDVAARDLYVAACRVIMRLVVVLFAEARDLLPQDNPRYHHSYGLEGLRDTLDRVGDPARRRHMYGAWPRLLALFRLIHGGSIHPELLVPTYGGELFAPGDASSADGLSRALAALESADDVSDQVVSEILDLLCRTRVRVRQGRTNTWVTAPVDFSDLSSEYIGILYEGLLDFELHRVADDPMLFLNLGTQPVLPLSRLEALDDKALKALVEAFKKSGKSEASEDAEDEAASAESPESGDDDGEAGSDEAPDESANGEPEGEIDTPRQETIERARAWAERAVRVGKLISARDLKDPTKVAAAAKALVVRTVLPGEWYLVRWGGTRKGSGTFYTRPQLAVPTVMRTLRPLAYQEPTEEGGEWTPRTPEEILAIKVCDPAMGSGSFLVAALRYLTQALHASLHVHGRIREHGRKTLVTLAKGSKSKGTLSEETLPLPPSDAHFDDRLHAVLKRHVVENCLYGVDLNALGVELGRLSLWVETMDPKLPFSFIDHKLKVGNSLVGAWFDTFQQYPTLAWDREGGDKGHKGVHFEGDAWTKAIKAQRRLATAGKMDNLFAKATAATSSQAHEEALDVMLELHEIPVHQSERRARLYREKILQNPVIASLRQAMDTWCATWFWPADKLDLAPMPATFQAPGKEALEIVQRLALEIGFFHWELEFPDVFASKNSGFSAIVGNPPWEIQKPSSKEFFSNIDSLYRTYGKQEALLHQRRYFEANKTVESDWLSYNAQLKAMGNWVKNVGSAKAQGQGFADPAHPFRHQGSADLNTYKMFLELGHALLRHDGLMGMIVPSGLYTDKGTMPLRELFLGKCRWEWLFGFENREKIFDIDSRFKFCPVIVRKGGKTERIMTAFMRHEVGDWEHAEAIAIPYVATQVTQFSPKTKAILEIRSARDLDILSTIYANAVLLGDDGPDGWGITYAREFDMTSDSKLFPPRPVWEAKGYKPDEYGRWLGPEGDIALPLYEGRMIGQFDFSEKGWISGAGRAAVWEDIDWDCKHFRPQFLMADSVFRSRSHSGDENGTVFRGAKVGFMAIGSATNSRTMFCTPLYDSPCGNSVAVLQSSRSIYHSLALSAVLNSFVYDMALRAKLGGLNLNYFVIEETPLIRQSNLLSHLAILTASLAWSHTSFSPAWLMLSEYSPALRRESMFKSWKLTEHERLRGRAIIDAIVAQGFGVDVSQFAAILKDTSHSPVVLANRDFSRSLDPKGFWRVDRDKPPELRLTTLALEAFKDLKAKGLEAFLAQYDGEGWMLPEYLEIDGELRPVRSVMGPRFLDWQLSQTPEESWAECERHARAILGEEGYDAFMRQLESGTEKTMTVSTASAGQLGLFGMN